MKFVRFVLYAMVVLAIFTVVGGFAVFFLLSPKIPRLPDDLKLLASSPPTEVYSRDGDLLKRIGGRQYVPIERISPHLLQAVIATEDRRFYRHHGIDHIAALAAVWGNLWHPSTAPGRSTITQQLAKNLFFTFRRSWKRKALEALAAMAIEDRFSKDEILEAYVNLVNYGRYAFGIERASQTYFGKHASELDLHEAALLAGLPNSPSRLNPLSYPERAANRQRTVLQRMAAVGMIEPGRVDSLAAEPWNMVQKSAPRERGSYAVDYALETAGGMIGDDIVSYGGVKITTTIDPILNRLAQRTLANGIDDLEQRLKPLGQDDSTRLEGALVAIEVASGQIVAMVGGRDYHVSTYNRAVRSLRQPGSAFKPVIYLSALETSKINAASVLVDEPVKIDIDKRRSWSPENFDGQYQGPVTLKYALMKSINTISAQLIEKVTPKNVVKTAKLLGVGTPLKHYYALALGAQGATAVDMANVFSTLAREGVALEPAVINQIEGRSRDLMYENLTAGESRFAPETVYQLIDMMMGVMDGGTGTVTRRRGFKGIAIGKTGTSSDFRDSWFCGATPTLAVAVWVGYDDNRPMMFNGNVGVTGASGAAPIWADFMIRATAGEPARVFPMPPNIHRAYAHPTNGHVSIVEQPGYISIVLTEQDLKEILQRQGDARADSLMRL